METTRASLIARIRDLSNSGSWEEFDAIYRPMLRRYGRSLGLSGEPLEDVVQQCMSSISQHIGGFQYDPDQCRFRTWLYRIVQNQTRSHFRKRAEALMSGTEFKNLVSPLPKPDNVFERMWFQQHFEHCLKMIKADVQPKTFEAYKLYVLEGMPADEVCSQLDFTRDQLYRLKWRLTRKLRDNLQDLLGDECDRWLSE